VELGFSHIDLAEKLSKLALDFFEFIFNISSLTPGVSQMYASVTLKIQYGSSTRVDWLLVSDSD